MIKTKVEAGICGFVTKIEASSKDSRHVSFEIDSQCENIKKLAEKIKTVDALQEIRDGFD